jgi:hypothetical protein
MKNKLFLLYVGITIFAACAGSGVEKSDELPLSPPDIVIIKLDIVRAFDMRLPVISETDFRQILSGAESVLTVKFGGIIQFEFTDHGQIPVDELFKDQSYRNSKLYQSWKPYKYDIQLGKNMPVFSDPAYLKKAADFLKMYSMESLGKYFPGVTLKDYDHAAELLIDTYQRKVEWLKTLKTAKGVSLLIKNQPPQQSFIEWYAMMSAQDKYDIVIANSLIVYDLITSPYPHTVCKHAKAGGASFSSPARDAFGGNSVMINILEDYGNIPGISADYQDIAPETKNKIIGAILLAHEIGHAYFHIPDVYDHPVSCLMNTPNGDVSNPELYAMLIADMTPCPKCKPWVDAKLYSIMADNETDDVKKGDLYIICAEKTAGLMGKDLKNFYDQKVYIAGLFNKALAAYQKAGDKKKIAECDKKYYSMFPK